MTSSLLTPRRRARLRASGAGAAATGTRAAMGSTAPTRILDRRHPRVVALLRRIEAEAGSARLVGAEDRSAFLRVAHRHIAEAVRPVYSVREDLPVSEVLRRGRGSCSQRLAVLEAVARASGVPTRVRGLLVDGRFWYPRFPRLRRFVPDQVVLAWPEFRVAVPAPVGGPAGPWLSTSELFGSLNELSGRRADGFSNAGAETLFDALSRTAIDWDGTTLCPASGAGCDLSGHVLADLGHFDSRDELFARHGQTLCATARLLAEPVLGRRGAGAGLAALAET
ncbi:transglutaminase domain-containing protein [Streptomyces sp. NPDC094149]|uniref:transglutaminase domain-containing protein n=1 Tax=Streptomyces sp. NPDC094149 TaxID=3155079 RepID=UPI0033217C0F